MPPKKKNADEEEREGIKKEKKEEERKAKEAKEKEKKEKQKLEKEKKAQEKREKEAEKKEKDKEKSSKKPKKGKDAAEGVENPDVDPSPLVPGSQRDDREPPGIEPDPLLPGDTAGPIHIPTTDIPQPPKDPKTAKDAKKKRKFPKPPKISLPKRGGGKPAKPPTGPQPPIIIQGEVVVKKKKPFVRSGNVIYLCAILVGVTGLSLTIAGYSTPFKLGPWGEGKHIQHLRVLGPVFFGMGILVVIFKLFFTEMLKDRPTWKPAWALKIEQQQLSSSAALGSRAHAPGWKVKQVINIVPTPVATGNQPLPPYYPDDPARPPTPTDVKVPIPDTDPSTVSGGSGGYYAEPQFVGHAAIQAEPLSMSGNPSVPMDTSAAARNKSTEKLLRDNNKKCTVM